MDQFTFFVDSVYHTTTIFPHPSAYFKKDLRYHIWLAMYQVLPSKYVHKPLDFTSSREEGGSLSKASLTRL